MKVGICISTLRRQDFLKELIISILSQEINDEVFLTIIVVDNDVNRTSEATVFAFNDLPERYSLIYDVAPIRGIPQSRNKAYSHIQDDTDYVIFVDDDEVAKPGWLQELISVQKKTSADIVSGPVFPRFLHSCPKWIHQGKYFLRSDYVSFVNGGTIDYKVVKTNNVLIYNKLIKQLEGPFDEQMALTGGSDSDLAYRLHRLGAKIVWSSDAVVEEFIPRERASLKWILRRAYRTANTSYKLSPAKGSLIRLKLILLGLIRIILGVLFLPFSFLISAFFGWHKFVNTLRVIVRGVGFVTSGIGIKYEEYRVLYND